MFLLRSPYVAPLLAATLMITTPGAIKAGPIFEIHTAADANYKSVELTSDKIALPIVGQPEVRIDSQSIGESVAEMVTDGYTLVGYSTYDGQDVPAWLLRIQARKVGAQVVIHESRDSGSETIGAVGGSTPTRLGLFALAIPVTIERYDQAMLFFAKTARHGLGVSGHTLTPSEAADLGTNKGIMTLGVARGSPAFMADILPGDLITSINGQAVYDNPTFVGALHASYGTMAKLAILRNGLVVEKDVTLPANGDW